MTPEARGSREKNRSPSTEFPILNQLRAEVFDRSGLGEHGVGSTDAPGNCDSPRMTLPFFPQGMEVKDAVSPGRSRPLAPRRTGDIARATCPQGLPKRRVPPVYHCRRIVGE